METLTHQFDELHLSNEKFVTKALESDGENQLD